MRDVMVVVSLLLAGCPAATEDDGTCKSEQLVDSANVSGSQIARVADRVMWTEIDPTEVQLLAVDESSGTSSGLTGIFAYGRGMAVDGDVVYWTAVLTGMQNSALYATRSSGLTDMVAMFPGCTGPVGVAIQSGRWWVGFEDCGGMAVVRTGTGATESAMYPVDEINDLLPGFVLTDSTIQGFDPPRELTLPILGSRRFARQGDTFYVTGNEQLNAVPLDGSAPERLFNFLPGLTDLVVDADSIYVVNSTDNDPGVHYLPITGGDPVRISEHMGSAPAIAHDSNHVYWVTRGRQMQKGIWRVEKCK